MNKLLLIALLSFTVSADELPPLQSFQSLYGQVQEQTRQHQEEYNRSYYRQLDTIEQQQRNRYTREYLNELRLREQRRLIYQPYR